MRSYIISLSKIESSKGSAEEVYTSLVNYGLDPVLFEGTYGNAAEKLFLKQNRNLHESYQYKENNKLTSPGVKGCFLSHYRLWELCVDKNEPIMIFEDDVIFVRNYEPVDFKNVLILSLNYDWKLTTPYRKYLEEKSKTSEVLPYNLNVMPGASGYIIKPHAALILLKEYQNTYLPADLAINSTLFEIEIHSRLMGRSKTIDEKTSLTRTRLWNSNGR